MIRWTTVPECGQCEVAMMEMEEFYQCPNCGFTINEEDIEN